MEFRKPLLTLMLPMGKDGLLQRGLCWASSPACPSPCQACPGAQRGILGLEANKSRYVFTVGQV